MKTTSGGHNHPELVLFSLTRGLLRTPSLQLLFLLRPLSPELPYGNANHAQFPQVAQSGPLAAELSTAVSGNRGCGKRRLPRPVPPPLPGSPRRGRGEPRRDRPAGLLGAADSPRLPGRRGRTAPRSYPAINFSEGSANFAQRLKKIIMKTETKTRKQQGDAPGSEPAGEATA